jgi:hypothetical protein
MGHAPCQVASDHCLSPRAARERARARGREREGGGVGGGGGGRGPSGFRAKAQGGGGETTGKGRSPLRRAPQTQTSTSTPPWHAADLRSVICDLRSEAEEGAPRSKKKEKRTARAAGVHGGGCFYFAPHDT